MPYFYQQHTPDWLDDTRPRFTQYLARETTLKMMQENIPANHLKSVRVRGSNYVWDTVREEPELMKRLQRDIIALGYDETLIPENAGSMSIVFRASPMGSNIVKIARKPNSTPYQIINSPAVIHPTDVYTYEYGLYMEVCPYRERPRNNNAPQKAIEQLAADTLSVVGNDNDRSNLGCLPEDKEGNHPVLIDRDGVELAFNEHYNDHYMAMRAYSEQALLAFRLAQLAREK